MKFRSKIAAALLFTSLLTTSCYGPNKTFNSLNDWNQTVAEQDWVNEVIFFGMHIVPVYEFVYLFDIVILNTIEYWSAE